MESLARSRGQLPSRRGSPWSWSTRSSRYDLEAAEQGVAHDTGEQELDAPQAVRRHGELPHDGHEGLPAPRGEEVEVAEQTDAVRHPAAYAARLATGRETAAPRA